MSKLVHLCFVLLFCCFLFFGFSDMSLDAAAVVDPNYHIMTAQETRDYIGTSLSGQVLLSDNTFASVTFSHTGTNSDVAAIDPSDYNFDADWLQGRVLLRYDADVSGLSLANQSRDHGGRLAMIDIPFSARNVTHFDFPMFSWCDLGEVSSAGYSYCQDYAYYEYTDSRFSSSAFSVGYCERGTSTNSVATIRVGWSGTGCIFYRPHWYVTQQDSTPFSISFISISCPFMYSENNKISIFLACPEVNTDIILGASDLEPDWGDGQSVGEVTGTIEDDGNGTQNINVTVNTDNSGLVASILNGIKNLFVPTDDQLASFSADMIDLLQDHLGGLYEAVDLISDQYDSFGSVTAKTELYVPETTIHLLGSDSFSVGPWYIPLKLSDSRFQFVYTALAFIFDFLFTVAFVNMCRRKLEVFLSPDSEVITDDS